MTLLTKRKFAMDQMRRGLDCPEVLSLIQKYPDEMKEYFVEPDMMIRKVFANANGKGDSEEKEQARKFLVSNFKFSNSSSVATCHRDPPECFGMFLYYRTVPRVIEPRTCTCIWSSLCPELFFWSQQLYLQFAWSSFYLILHNGPLVVVYRMG